MPEAHAGRLLDHVHLRVSDLEASKRFYAVRLAPLGLGSRARVTAGSPRTSSSSATTGRSTAGLHLASRREDREAVDRFHEAALAAGGRDNGAPGERRYHPGYYAAFVLDPDGTNVEAVYHGPVRPLGAFGRVHWD